MGILSICLSLFSISIFSFNAFFLTRSVRKYENLYKQEVKRNFDLSIDWISQYRKKNKELEKLGIFLPLENMALDQYEKKLMDAYSSWHDYINDETVKQSIDKCLQKQQKKN